MSYSLLRTIQPALEPVTLAQAYAQCRLAVGSDDATLSALITAARVICEDQLGRAFLQQTWQLTLPNFPTFGWGYAGGYWPGAYGPMFGSCGSLPSRRTPNIILPRPNLIGVESITYLDTTSTRQTLDPSQYVISQDDAPAIVAPIPGAWWPVTMYGRPDNVQITYTAGYGATAATVPQTIIQAMLMLISHWYDNRGVTSMTTGVLPVGVAALLAAETVPAFTYESC